MLVAKDCGQGENRFVPVADILVFSGAMMALKHNGSDGEQIDAPRMGTAYIYIPIPATGVVVRWPRTAS